MLTPKLYQLQAVETLTEFLRRSRALGGPAVAFTQLTSERSNGKGVFAMAHGRGFVSIRKAL